MLSKAKARYEPGEHTLLLVSLAALSTGVVCDVAAAAVLRLGSVQQTCSTRLYASTLQRPGQFVTVNNVISILHKSFSCEFDTI